MLQHLEQGEKGEGVSRGQGRWAGLQVTYHLFLFEGNALAMRLDDATPIILAGILCQLDFCILRCQLSLLLAMSLMMKIKGCQPMLGTILCLC